MFYVGLAHVVGAWLFWFIYCGGGVNMMLKQAGDTLYWWVYFSAVLSFTVAWAPVLLAYPLATSDDLDLKTLFLYAVMATIDGPFFGNFFPIIFAWVCYKTGYTI
jgi:hypothetical protein